MNHIRLGMPAIYVILVAAADEVLDVLVLGWMVPESDPKVVVVRRALLHRLVRKGMVESYAGIVVDGDMMVLRKKACVHLAANSVKDVVSFRSVPVSLWIHAFRLPSRIHQILKAKKPVYQPPYSHCLLFFMCITKKFTWPFIISRWYPIRHVLSRH